MSVPPPTLVTMQPTRSVRPFEVVSEYAPAGDQPQAIAELAARINAGETDVVLLGATGTGKSATTAWLIEQVQRPTLVLAHNKTLAAQLANEFRELLPNNAVEYFVSYYDYYQPEAYVPQTDTFIEKDSSVNAEVERLRHSTTNSLLSRRDVVVVSTVSCIYGLGAPEEYLRAMVALQVGGSGTTATHSSGSSSPCSTTATTSTSRAAISGCAATPSRSSPVYEEHAIRIELFGGDEIEALYSLHPLTGEVIAKLDSVPIFPASHYVAGTDVVQRAIGQIEEELAERLAELERQGKLLEAQRLRMRTTFDLEMLQQLGFCSGIENYSRHMDGRQAGEPPHTLLDFFPRRLPAGHRRVARDGAADRRHVRGRRLPQAHARRSRLPAAERSRQPSAPLGRVHQADRSDRLPLRHPRASTRWASRTGVVEQIIRPTGWWIPRSS